MVPESINIFGKEKADVAVPLDMSSILADESQVVLQLNGSTSHSSSDQVFFMDKDSNDQDTEQIASCNDVTHEGTTNTDMYVSELDLHNCSSEILEPHEGMEFDSSEEAFAFYISYAKQEGFRVTKRSSRRSRASRELIDAKFVCSRYGKKQIKGSGVRERHSSKIECIASMSVKKRKSDGKWYAYLFVKEHNHDLVEAEVNYPSYSSRVHNPRRRNSRAFSSAGLVTGKVYAAVPMQSIGYQKGDCLMKDGTNEVIIGRHLSIEEGDAQAMYKFFFRMQEENPNFFYALDLDVEHLPRNVLWVDAKSRNDYTSFGDVISFDMTYIISRCKMPLVSFLGVNHHKQPILLGCALISELTASTFIWLMKSWLTAMGGVAPKAIITHHDKVIRVAVEQVFPKSNHGYCLWHIRKKLSEKLPHVIQNHDAFMGKLNKCIHNSWTNEEFERRWSKLKSRFGLEADEWFKTLHDDRKQWVPTYLRERFFAGMSTAHMSESSNSFFDKYMSRETSLKEFLEKYEIALHDRCQKESLADFQSWHIKPVLKSPSPYEFQVSTVYTREIFNQFQVEVMGAHACYAIKEKEEGSLVTYRVNDIEQKSDFVVEWNCNEQQISCLCLSFQFKGYLCRHALMVLQFSGVSTIPSRYILIRWTKQAKSGLISSLKSDVQSRIQRFNDISRRALVLAEEGSRSEESYNLARGILEQGVKKCVEMNHHYVCNS